MAKRARTSAYSASDLARAVEATRANVTVTDSLSSDEEASPAKASQQNQTSVKRARRSKKGRSSQAANGSRVIQEEVEVTSYVRSTAPRQAEAVTMADLLPLLNGASGNSTNDQLSDDEEVDQLAEASDQSEGAFTAPIPPTLGAVVAHQATAEGSQGRDETATPTPAQQSPPKKKRGRPSKADIAEKQSLAQKSATTISGDATAPPPSGLPLPATSSKKRRRLLKARRESSTPAVEIRDSLFATQEADSVGQDEQESALFRSPSVESDSPPPPASTTHLGDKKRKRANEAVEEPPKKVQQKNVKVSAKDKGKARAISPVPVKEIAVPDSISDSSSEEAEEEVQKSLVQDLPKRKSARKQKGAASKVSEATTASSSSKMKASTAKKPTTRKSTAAKTATASTSVATPAKKAAKATKATATSAAATPVASGSVPATGTQPPGASALMPTPAANKPKWIRDRIRKLTIQQHKNFLAHRTRGADRARGNPWSEDEEITLILALNDMYMEGATLGDQTANDVTKNQYKRWRNIQEQHGVGGSLSDILAQRSNVDLKDKARNIQKYRDALGLPVFNWYTYARNSADGSESDGAEEA